MKKSDKRVLNYDILNQIFTQINLEDPYYCSMLLGAWCKLQNELIERGGFYRVEEDTDFSKN